MARPKGKANKAEDVAEAQAVAGPEPTETVAVEDAGPEVPADETVPVSVVMKLLEREADLVDRLKALEQKVEARGAVSEPAPEFPDDLPEPVTFRWMKYRAGQLVVYNGLMRKDPGTGMETMVRDPIIVKFRDALYSTRSSRMVKLIRAEIKAQHLEGQIEDLVAVRQRQVRVAERALALAKGQTPPPESEPAQATPTDMLPPGYTPMPQGQDFSLPTPDELPAECHQPDPGLIPQEPPKPQMDDVQFRPRPQDSRSLNRPTVPDPDPARQQ